MDKKLLKKILEENSVAYQYADGLIEFSESSCADFLNRVGEGTMQEVNKAQLMEDGWDIAEWAIETDTMLLVDGDLVFCLSKEIIDSYHHAA